MGEALVKRGRQAGIAAGTALMILAMTVLPASAQTDPAADVVAEVTGAFGDLRGVVIALIVLFFTLGSLRAAGMPLLTALLGVGITMALIFASTGLGTVSSTTPMLALMLGLAVGIDYALFILARHANRATGDVLWVPGGERTKPERRARDAE